MQEWVRQTILTLLLKCIRLNRLSPKTKANQKSISRPQQIKNQLIKLKIGLLLVLRGPIEFILWKLKLHRMFWKRLNALLISKLPLIHLRDHIQAPKDMRPRSLSVNGKINYCLLWQTHRRISFRLAKNSKTRWRVFGGCVTEKNKITQV